MSKDLTNKSSNRKRSSSPLLTLANNSDQSEYFPADSEIFLTLKNSAHPDPALITIDKEQLLDLIAYAASSAAVAAQVQLLKQIDVLTSLVTQLQQQITFLQGEIASVSLSSAKHDVNGVQESKNSTPPSPISPLANEESKASVGPSRTKQKTQSYASIVQQPFTSNSAPTSSRETAHPKKAHPPSPLLPASHSSASAPVSAPMPTPTPQRPKPATAKERFAAFYSQLRLALAPPADGSDPPQPQQQKRVFKTIFQGVGDPEKRKSSRRRTASLP